MSLETRIAALATAIGLDIKALFAAGGGAGVVKGTAILDFGPAGSDVATVTVPALTLTAGQQIRVALSPLGTPENDADEHFAEPAQPKVTARTSGASFEISMASTDKFNLHGTWLVDWSIY